MEITGTFILILLLVILGILAGLLISRALSLRKERRDIFVPTYMAQLDDCKKLYRIISSEIFRKIDSQEKLDKLFEICGRETEAQKIKFLCEIMERIPLLLSKNGHELELKKWSDFFLKHEWDRY